MEPWRTALRAALAVLDDDALADLYAWARRTPAAELRHVLTLELDREEEDRGADA